MQKLFAETSFAEKSECLARKFERYGLDAYDRWQNAPVVFGNRVCGEDIYSVISELNRAYTVDSQAVPELEGDGEEGEANDQTDEEGEEEQERELEERDADTIFNLVERGVSEDHVRALASAGVMTLSGARDMSKKDLSQLLQTFDGIGERTAEKIISAIG